MRARDGEPQEDDVAGHICDEHMAQSQIAEGVDETRDQRHRYEEGREGSKGGRSARYQGLSDFSEEGVHLQTPFLGWQMLK